MLIHIHMLKSDWKVALKIWWILWWNECLIVNLVKANSNKSSISLLMVTIKGLAPAFEIESLRFALVPTDASFDLWLFLFLFQLRQLFRFLLNYFESWSIICLFFEESGFSKDLLIFTAFFFALNRSITIIEVVRPEHISHWGFHCPLACSRLVHVLLFERICFL